MKCNLCPRKCNIDRAVSKGACGEGEEIRVALSMLHFFEEPVISGEKGSGAIFFSGCPLKCVFCQNGDISHSQKGKIMSESQLGDLMLSLQQQGAHNINLVTPTHFADKIFNTLERVKPKLSIPVIYNCGGYESTETIIRSRGLIDVYLPDFKYFSPTLSQAYSAAPDYFEVASKAISLMLEAQPKVVIRNGLIRKGVIIRHLVLPSCVEDSMKIIDFIARNHKGALVSVMRQYTPDFYRGNEKNLRRRLTSYEYDKVISRVRELGLEGFMQQKGCESSSFTPRFNQQ